MRAFVRPREPIVVPEPMRRIMGWSDEQYDAAAVPTYPCLIDEKHVVAELYDMPNVPMAVWIDEDGRIVRPAEPAGASDGFRQMNRETFELPADVAGAGRALRAKYVAAIRDWVEHGPASRFALSESDARERVTGPSDDDATAAASFQLGLYLRDHGKAERAKHWFGEARRLAPDRWTFFRQALHLEETGKASGPEFQAAVRVLGERSYYPELVLEPSEPA